MYRSAATAAGVATAGIATAVIWYVQYMRKRHRRASRMPPPWFQDLIGGGEFDALCIPEWDNSTAWRRSNGWVGTDYAHSADGAVYIAGYGLGKTTEGQPKLVGAVHFGTGAESHRGLCHGGTMCTIMDDVIGWTGFCVGGTCKPWSGFTVQINTKLQAPIEVGSWLRVEGEIIGVERRKVSVRASLTSPATTTGGEPVVHCTAEGLFVMKKE